MILQQTELSWSCWEESQIQNQYELVNQHQAIAIRKNMEDLYKYDVFVPPVAQDPQISTEKRRRFSAMLQAPRSCSW